MGNTLLGVWLILFGAMALVATKVPDWIVPVAAICVGLVVLSGGGWWKKS
jgi:hypothetical protein